MKNTSTPDDSTSEQQRLLAEAVALDRRGKVRQAELVSLEARLQRAMDEDDRKLRERLEKIEQQSAVVTPPASRGSQTLVLGLLIYSLLGLPFTFTVGYRFVFAFADKYWAVAHWVFFSVLALLACVFLQAGVHQRRRELQPNWVKRWLMLTSIAVFMAGLVVFTTPGWAALFGWIAGGPISALEARIVSVGNPSRRADGCRQTAQLLVNGALTTLCLDGRAPTPALVASESVLLVGRSSWFGLFVHEIRRR